LPRTVPEGIASCFEPETLAELQARVRQQGVGPTTLARMSVLQNSGPKRRGVVCLQRGVPKPSWRRPALVARGRIHARAWGGTPQYRLAQLT
jgi:hypothetical protein